MSQPPVRITYLTAGAAGMYCGSCLHDNTLARELIRGGSDVQLLPVYTPIRTDEADVSENRLFFGGINVFLQQKLALFRLLPRWLDRCLDWPSLVRRLTAGRIGTDARLLGDLTISMLKGSDGNQHKEVKRLVGYLARHELPHLIHLSNILIAGCLPEIKRRLAVPVIVTLQGDDLFLQDLPAPYQREAIEQIGRLDASVDGYIVYSRFYADAMSEFLHLPREKFHIVPLGIDVEDINITAEVVQETAASDVTIGFFARHCPAKGFHQLVDAFIELRCRPGLENVRLRSAGWLGTGDQKYFDEQLRKLEAVGLRNAFEYAGIVDRKGKIDFYRSLDMLSVPTTYREPKGLFALEAMACGVPVVLPEHGVFPEMIAKLKGGVLFPPGDVSRLADSLEALCRDSASRIELGEAGRREVFRQRTAPQMATATLRLFREILARQETVD